MEQIKSMTVEDLVFIWCVSPIQVKIVSCRGIHSAHFCLQEDSHTFAQHHFWTTRTFLWGHYLYCPDMHVLVVQSMMTWMPTTQNDASFWVKTTLYKFIMVQKMRKWLDLMSGSSMIRPDGVMQVKVYCSCLRCLRLYFLMSLLSTLFIFLMSKSSVFIAVFVVGVRVISLRLDGVRCIMECMVFTGYLSCMLPAQK